MKRDGSIGTAGKGALTGEDVSFTVAATQDQTLFQPVSIQGDGERSCGGQNGAGVSEDGAMYTLNTVDRHSVASGYVVRRLTPIECERLQGFPDGWTDLTGCDADAVTDLIAASLLYDEGRAKALRRKVENWSQECPDDPRYKACGNSMAVPNMRWIFDRIQAYECLRETAVVATAWLDRERRF